MDAKEYVARAMQMLHKLKEEEPSEEELKIVAEFAGNEHFQILCLTNQLDSASFAIGLVLAEKIERQEIVN